MNFSALMGPYVKQIETQLEILARQFGNADHLAEAIRYSLLQKGKRIRPAITLMVAEALGTHSAMDSALALELFHTASLLADDLPCMDDATDRRGDIPTHKMFNEATALLASYALIAKGYQLIVQNASLFSSSTILPAALHNASQNTGYFGASGGQFLDLYATKIDSQLIDEVMTKKTAALFESAFLFGWLFGGREDHLEDVKRLGLHFGFAFQLVDDLLDYEEDSKADRKINYALYHGRLATKKRIEELLSLCLAELQKLQLNTPALTSILDLLSSKIQEAY